MSSYLQEAVGEYTRNHGHDQPEREWILSPFDTWEKNPWYTGKPGRRPEDWGYEDGEPMVDCVPFAEDCPF